MAACPFSGALPLAVAVTWTLVKKRNVGQVEGLFMATGRVLAARPRHVFLVGVQLQLGTQRQMTLRNSASSGQALRPPTFFSEPTDRRKSRQSQTAILAKKAAATKLEQGWRIRGYSDLPDENT